MKIGDLVKLRLLHLVQVSNPGSITGLLYFSRMKKRYGDKVGIILRMPLPNVEVLFETEKTIIHSRYLTLVN